ncbi:MAG: sialidase family protein [Lentisphaerota bacterium]
MNQEILEVSSTLSPATFFGPVPVFDLSGAAAAQTVIAAGNESYQGHPTTALLSDGRTVICVWTIGHGGPCGPMKKSANRGRTWSKLLPVPAEWSKFVNCPCIWRRPAIGMPDRLVVYVQEEITRKMFCSVSEDGGDNWGEMTSCGVVSVMPWTAIVPISGGRLLGLTNARRSGDATSRSNVIIRSYSADNGITWDEPAVVADLPGIKLCEPWIIASPDGDEMACLLRLNNREYNSMVIFSRNEGESWTKPVQVHAAITGDRHIVRYLPDGRLLAVFRDVASASPTSSHFCGWIGSYDDLKTSGTGQVRLKLLHHHAEPRNYDCGYPGLEIFSDGTALATTYLKYRAEDRHNSVVCIRFNPAEF